MLRIVGSHTSKLALACCVFLTSVTSPFLVHAKGQQRSDSQVTIQVAELPRQGQETYRLIRQGGPFPYEKDGTVFGNRERLLPPQKRGYYREYTVETPGARDRGARRIVCGGKPKAPDICFYTSDHYASFRKVEE